MDNMYGFIYVTTNIINGKKYLGMCAYHRPNHTTYLGSGKVLRRAIKKYGCGKFTRQIIRNCETKENMINSEIQLILEYDCVNDRAWYNINQGGFATRGFSGKTHSDETRLKMKLNHKRPLHVNTLEKFKENGKERIKYLQKHLKENFSVHQASKRIIYDDVIYDSIMECSKQLKINYSTLCARLRNSKFTNALMLP